LKKNLFLVTAAILNSVSERLLFNDNSAIKQQVNFQWNDNEARFVLDQHAELDFYSASSLKQVFR
jgi:hypothetical protein